MIYKKEVCSVEEFVSALGNVGVNATAECAGLKVSVFQSRVEIEWYDVEAPKKEPKRSPLVKVADNVIEKLETSTEEPKED
jgi:hypothetical protein